MKPRKGSIGVRLSTICFLHWLEDIRKGSCSLKSFLGVAREGIDERESGKFEEGKVKLSLYRTFGKIVEFKTYLRGVGDAGTRLLFKFRSGTHGLNEELGRHRGREGRKECLLCDAECESVSQDCHASQREGECVADYISRLEQLFRRAYGREGMSDETRDMLLHGQLQEGLQYELMKAPAVSGSHAYRELCLAARNEEKRIAETVPED